MLDKEVYYWARLPRTFWENSNILYLEEKDPSCIIFYLKLLSKTLNLNGYCRDEFGKWTIERIRTLTNCSGQKKTEENINLLIKLKLLEKKNGCLHISNFENLVGFETYGAVRKREQRNNKKENSNWDNVPENVPDNVSDNLQDIKKEERTKEESKINSKSNNNIYNKRKIEKRNCDKVDKKDKATAVSDGQIKPSNLTSILISKKIIQPNDAFIPEFNNLFDSFCLDEFGDFQQDLFKQTRDNIVYLATTIKHRSSKEKPINNMVGYFKTAMEDYRLQNERKEEKENDMDNKFNSNFVNPD